MVKHVVPILDRPEERPQCPWNLDTPCRCRVPILDRPEERPQSEIPGYWMFFWRFQSSIAPKSDRNVDKVRVYSIAPTVPILDRPEERPQCRGRLIVPIAGICSNPRSPRRATAIHLDTQRLAPYRCSNPRSPRRATAIDRWNHRDRTLTRFQSSIAPKSDRNAMVVTPLGAVLLVPILDRPEERPQF